MKIKPNRQRGAIGVMGFLVTLTLAFTVVSLLVYCAIVLKKATVNIGSKYTNELETASSDQLFVLRDYYEGSSASGNKEITLTDAQVSTIGSWYFVYSTSVFGPWEPVGSFKTDQENAQLMVHWLNEQMMPANVGLYPQFYFWAYMEK